MMADNVSTLYPTADIKQALAFLERTKKGQPVNLVAIHPDERKPIGITRPQGHPDIEAFIERHVGKRNVYFLANEPKPDAPDKKLTKQHIARVTTIFADTDPKGDDLAAARHQLLEQAHELRDELWAPTYTIDSGGGLQHFWQLREPIDVTPETQQQAEAQGRGIARQLDGDSIYNIDRIMRLPGTTNLPDARKRALGRKPAAASILWFTGATYHLPALASFAQPITDEQAQQDAGATAYNGPLDMSEVMSAETPDALPTPLRERLAAILAADARAAALWKGEPQGLRDNSRSGFDFAMAGILKHAGLTATETGQILWTYEHGRGPDIDERYLRRAYGRAPEPHDLPAANDEFDRVALGDEHLAKPPTPVAAHPAPPNALAQRGSLYALAYEDAGHARDNPYLIKGLLDQGAMSVLYGESNQGKTFVALDMAHAIATGRDWFGKRVHTGLAVYVAAEAGRGIGKRVRALQQHYGKPAGRVPLAIVPCPIDLLRPDAHVQALTDLVRDLERQYGPAVLVVIDTLSRALAGGNENAPDDMGAFVMNADRIRAALGCHMMIVHHSGKDRAKGARGHSLLRAATDTEIEVADFVVTATKQRDMESGVPAHFALTEVIIGADDEGEPVTSCVVVHEGVSAMNEFDVPLTQNEAEGVYHLTALAKLLAERDGVKPVEGADGGKVLAIKSAHLKAAYVGYLLEKEEEMAEKKCEQGPNVREMSAEDVQKSELWNINDLDRFYGLGSDVRRYRNTAAEKRAIRLIGSLRTKGVWSQQHGKWLISLG